MALATDGGIVLKHLIRLPYGHPPSPRGEGYNPPVSLSADSPLYTRGPLFYSSLYFASMVDTLLVISSNTSNTMRTVSRLENKVTPFSTAQRRISTPSS